MYSTNHNFINFKPVPGIIILIVIVFTCTHILQTIISHDGSYESSQLLQHVLSLFLSLQTTDLSSSIRANKFLLQKCFSYHVVRNMRAVHPGLYYQLSKKIIHQNILHPTYKWNKRTYQQYLYCTMKTYMSLVE